MALLNNPVLTTYRGRFAPSPSGPLHAGSILAALASYLDAKAHHGLWFVRIEDLDPPRESPAAAAAILHTLENLGLHWDGPVLYQSQRHAAYVEALQELISQHLVYACVCSRQTLTVSNFSYTGICRNLNLPLHTPAALRCRVTDQKFLCNDRIQGQFMQRLEHDVGDFVIRRKDGLFAYQLAVVVDDAFQGITDVVRGIDLLDSTPRQIYLQEQLGFTPLRYAHVPILINSKGQKLGKQQYAKAIDNVFPAAELMAALTHLRQEPDPTLASANPAEILAWAITHWDIDKLKGIIQIPEN